MIEGGWNPYFVAFAHAHGCTPEAMVRGPRWRRRDGPFGGARVTRRRALAVLLALALAAGLVAVPLGAALRGIQ